METKFNHEKESILEAAGVDETVFDEWREGYDGQHLLADFEKVLASPYAKLILSFAGDDNNYTPELIRLGIRKPSELAEGLYKWGLDLYPAIFLAMVTATAPKDPIARILLIEVIEYLKTKSKRN